MEIEFYDLEVCKNNIKNSLIEIITNFDKIENLNIIKRYELTIKEVNKIIKFNFNDDKNYKKNNKLFLKYYNDNLLKLLEKLRDNFDEIKSKYKLNGIIEI